MIHSTTVRNRLAQLDHLLANFEPISFVIRLLALEITEEKISSRGNLARIFGQGISLKDSVQKIWPQKTGQKTGHFSGTHFQPKCEIL